MHHFAKFGAHSICGSKVITFLKHHVLSRDAMIKRSYDTLNRNFAYSGIMLSSLVLLGIVEVII